MRVLLVDDEELSLLELEYILENVDYIDSISKASSGFEALKLCRKNDFDVLFLDIKLGDTNGIKVAQRLIESKNPPIIVFVTAYDDYAVKAFELQAVDYVLKPFSKERIIKTLDRLKGIFKNKNKKQDKIEKNINVLNKLVIEQENSIALVDIEKIIFIKADGRNSEIKTLDGKFKSKSSLKELERRLDNRFFRPHRSYIINLERIKEVVPWFNGTYIVKMDRYDKVDIPVTRKNTARFKKILNL